MFRVSPVRLLLLPLLLIILLFPSDVSAQEPLTQTYTNPDGSFSFSYPQSWNLDVDKDGVSVVDDDHEYMLGFYPNQVEQETLGKPFAEATPMELAEADRDYWETMYAAEVSELETITLGPYPCVRFLIREPTMDAADSVEYVLDTGDTLSVIIGGPVLAGHFKDHQQVVEAIIESFRSPAGASVLAQKRDVAATIVPQFVTTTVAVAAGREQIAADTGLNVSVHVPPGWQFRTLTDVPLYSSALIFGETTEAVQNAAANLKTDAKLPVLGAYGGVGIVKPSLWTRLADNPDTAVQILMSSAAVDLNVVGAAGLMVAGRTIDCLEVSIAGVNTRGYVGGFNASGEVVLFSLLAGPTANFESYRQTLIEVAATIQVPAEPGAVTEPPVVVVQPTPLPPTVMLVPTRVAIPTLAPTQTIVRVVPGDVLDLGNHTLSIRLPVGWKWIDRSADQGIIVFGDTEAARLSRLGAIRPDLQPQAPAISGTGGVVALYPMDTLGLTPATLDLKALMARVLDGLKGAGYTIEAQPQPIHLEQHNGLYAIVRGAEYGYLALVPFDDTVAYITGTGTPDTFAASQAILLQVVESVHVPALQASSQTTVPGLFGLHVAPTATPAGLTGLGGHTVERTSPTSEPTP